MTEQTYRRYRFRADCPVEVMTDTGLELVHARNVNLDGMCIDRIKNASSGQKLTVLIDAEPHRCEVRWVSERQVGISFLQDVSARKVDFVRFTRNWGQRDDTRPANAWAF